MEKPSPNMATGLNAVVGSLSDTHSSWPVRIQLFHFSIDKSFLIRDILEGQRGPKRDMVLLNAAAAFVAAGSDGDFEEGIKRARGVIDSGRARKKLDASASFTQQRAYFVRKEL